MADWDAESFEEPDLPIPSIVKKAVVADKWEGEDEEEDVKDNWDDEEEEAKKVEAKKAAATKVSEKKKLSEKIKERENKLKKQQEEEEMKQEELSAEEQVAEKLRVRKLQEDAERELTREAFGIGNSVTGIDAMCPSSKDDFTEFEKVLREKITQFEKSAHYSDFLDSMFRELCISLEIEDLKKISNSLAALLSEKQKIDKQSKAGKKKGKKGVIAGGGLKAKMRDDLEFDLGGYAQDYEDFM